MVRIYNVKNLPIIKTSILSMRYKDKIEVYFFTKAPVTLIAIGKTLMLSPSFPLLHTQRATFTALGVPSYSFRLKQLNYKLYEIGLASSIVFHLTEECSYIAQSSFHL